MNEKIVLKLCTQRWLLSCLKQSLLHICIEKKSHAWDALFKMLGYALLLICSA